MMYHSTIHRPKTAQRGITLIEALMALLILALGVLGLAAVQARMLVETRTTNARATAIRLIADLGERIRMNIDGAQPAAGTVSPYADGTATGEIGTFYGAPEDSPDCNPIADPPVPCTTSAAQAQYDIWAWRSEVAASLMNGQASILQAGPQQLQVIVAWQANENTNITPTGTAADRQLDDALQITATDQTTGLCPAGAICHVDFINIPPPG